MNNTKVKGESGNPLDNMSISEIIARKYKKKVHQVKSPQEAAKLLIKDTSEFDVNALEYTEGSQTEQK